MGVKKYRRRVDGPDFLVGVVRGGGVELWR